MPITSYDSLEFNITFILLSIAAYCLVHAFLNWRKERKLKNLKLDLNKLALIIDKDIAHNIRTIRKEKKITQHTAAQALGISQSQYSKMERSIKKGVYVSLSSWIKLLNVKPERLFGGIE